MENKVTYEDLQKAFKDLMNEDKAEESKGDSLDSNKANRDTNKDATEDDDSSSVDDIELSEDEIDTIVSNLGSALGLSKNEDINEQIKIKSDSDFDFVDDSDEDINDTVDIKIPNSELQRNNRESILDKERAKLHEELKAKEELKKSIANYEVTTEMYQKGQRLLAKENGGVKTEEKFNPEDYVVAAMIKQNKGRKPDMIPNPKDKWIQIASFNNINSSKSMLNDKNSIDCSGLSKSKLINNVPNWVVKSPKSARLYKKNIFSNLLKGAKKNLGGDIQRLIISNNILIINGKMVNFNGVFGGDSSLDIVDILDFSILRKEAPKLLALSIDDEAFEVLCNEYIIDLDIVEVAKTIFNQFNLLNEFVVNSTKITRNMINSMEREERIKELREDLKELRNRREFDAELKSRLTRVGGKSFKDLLKDSNRDNIAGKAEKRLITKGGVVRGIGGGALVVASFLVVGAFNILDWPFKGYLHRGFSHIKSGLNETANVSAGLWNWSHNVGKK